jgi:hypothetical protein
MTPAEAIPPMCDLENEKNTLPRTVYRARDMWDERQANGCARISRVDPIRLRNHGPKSRPKKRFASEITRPLQGREQNVIRDII